MAVVDELGLDFLDRRISKELYLYPITAAITAGFPMEVVKVLQPNPGLVSLTEEEANERGFNMTEFIEASQYPQKKKLREWWEETRALI